MRVQEDVITTATQKMLWWHKLTEGTIDDTASKVTVYYCVCFVGWGAHFPNLCATENIDGQTKVYGHETQWVDGRLTFLNLRKTNSQFVVVCVRK